MVSHAVMDYLPTLGANLRIARKKAFPADTLASFALRVGVSRATLQKMEQGDLSVSLAKYYSAATVLDLTATFDALLQPADSLFDD
jgi:transcriptional regulator with XRE-family HTH domain